MSQWWNEWRDEQDRDPEHEAEVQAASKLRIAEAESKVQIAADNLCSLWPKLESTKKKTRLVWKGFWAETHLKFGKTIIKIVSWDGPAPPMFTFHSGENKLNEQQVAELIGVVKRF